MYKHLLVPVDGTELSMGNITSAVRLAEALGAGVTFCHVTPDFAGSRAANRLRRLDGAQALAYARDADLHARSHANSLMLKAAACARTLGVANDTITMTSEDPAGSIAAVAGEKGCDLIVMASHAVTGLRTLLRSSLTSKVLREAGVPVLITRVEATDPHVHASRACALVQDEHRSLAAIVHGMEQLVGEARGHRSEGFDRDGFELMLRYVRDFSERLHHSKEEQTLHKLLRSRSDRADALLDSLEAEHRREHELVTALETAFTSCASQARGDEPSLASLVSALEAFAEHVWAHLSTEEQTLLPMALEILWEKDWAEVARAFESNLDPGYGGWSREEFRHHFSTLAARITPIGNADDSPS